MEKIIDRRRLEEIIRENKITEEGVIRGEKYDLNRHFDEEEFKELLEIIPLLYDTGSIGRGSYGLKHELEDFLTHNYVSNATTILAFKYLNFRSSRPNEAQAPNLTIYLKPNIKNGKVQPLARYIRALKTQLVASNS